MRLFTALIAVCLVALLAPAGALANPPGALRFFAEPGPPPGAPDPLAGSCVARALEEPVGSQRCHTAAPGLDGAYGVAVAPDLDGAGPQQEDVYAAAVNSDSVAAFRRDGDGKLQPAGCFSRSGAGGCGAAPGLGGAITVAVSPDGKHVYVGARESDAIVIFQRVPATGELTRLPDDPLTPGDDTCLSENTASGCVVARGLDHAAGLAFSPDGGNLYVAARAGDGVSIFRRDAASGALEQLPGDKGCFRDRQAPATGAADCSAAQALNGAYAVAVSADGRHVYVTSRVSDGIALFSRDPADGALTPLPDDPASSGDDACLTESEGSCVRQDAGLDGAAEIALSPGGGNAYVISYASYSVATLTRDPGSGRLTFSGCFSDERETDRCLDAPALAYPTDVVVSPDGANVYVSSRYRSAVAVFRRTGDGSLRRDPAPAGRPWSESCLSWRGHTWWQDEDRSASDHSDHRCARALALSYPSSLALSPQSGDLYVAAVGSDAVSTYRRIGASADWSPDDTAPAAAIASGLPSPLRGLAAEVTLNSEPDAALWCRLGNAPFRRCGRAHALGGLADGAHRFEVRASDPAGNVGSPTARDFTVDTSARAGAATARRAGRGRATLRAEVETGGRSSTAFFEYGRSSAAGERTPVAQIGSGPGALPLSASLARLSTGIPYLVRAVAVNAMGTARGPDQLFAELRTPAGVRGAWLQALARQRVADTLRRGFRTRGGCTGRCSVSLSLTVDAKNARRLGLTRRRAAVRIGAATVRLARAGEKPVSVRVTRAAARRLAKARSVPATLRAQVRDRRGRTARATSARLSLTTP